MEKPEKARKKSVQKLNPLPSSSKVINSEDSAWRSQGSASQNQVGTAPGENRDKISRVASRVDAMKKKEVAARGGVAGRRQRIE